jgi:hypothetical protein
MSDAKPGAEHDNDLHYLRAVEIRQMMPEGILWWSGFVMWTRTGRRIASHVTAIAVIGLIALRQVLVLQLFEHAIVIIIHAIARSLGGILRLAERARPAFRAVWSGRRLLRGRLLRRRMVLIAPANEE